MPGKSQTEKKHQNSHIDYTK